MHTNSDSTFVKHEGCDACGSSDANAVYSNGSKFCFSCQKHTPAPRTDNTIPFIKPERPIDTPITLTKDVELERLVSKWAAAPASSIPDRNITSTYAKQYGVIVDGDKHYYPYFNSESSEPCGFKVRTVSTKGFVAVGNIREAGLFGQQRYGNHKQRRIVVTEGELDALAASQMFEGKTPVVSLRSGISAAGRDFKAAYEFLDGFEEIILCFDADEPGIAGIEKAAEVFAGKLRVMKLDARIGKDACDYLKAGRSKDFTDLYWSASLYTPKGVLSKEELLQRLLAPRPDSLGDYPWTKLNELTYGFRPTELITIAAGSGLGKSSILREIVMHVKNTTNNRIGCLFMEESVERTAEGFMSVDLSTPLHLPHSTVTRASQEYLDAYERVYGDDRLFIMDAGFDIGASVDDVVSRVRFMAKALDCNVIVLDHISILVSAGQQGDERKALDEIMTKLRTLTQDTGIVLFAVSHLKRPEGKGHEEGAATSVAQLRGSASIAQLSDFVIGLERNGQADDPTERNTTRVRVLKNRFSGITGPAGHLLYNTDTGRLSEYTPPEEEAL
jgi:twinkle protein